MHNPLSRREALKRIGATSAGFVFARSVIRGQSSDIIVAGKPVEIIVSFLSSSTVRLTVLPIEGGRTVGVPADGAVVKEGEGRALARRRARERFDPVRAGNLVVRFAADPPTLHVETSGGGPVQRLMLDARAAGMSFLLSKGPLLGLGQGGPQFDRKGSVDRMRSGQGGFQLSTHGGRVPIQWLVGTDGWGMFIHQPLGAFDFTGPEGKFAPSDNGLPLDVFVVSSSSPPEIMREYARITGYAEMPALWTLGYMQSHRTLAGPDEVLGVARTMREKKLPCDALIYLGTEFTPSGWNTRNGEFTWHSGNFPDPKGLIDELHAQHFRVVLHIVIEGRRLTGTVNEPCDPKNAVPSGRTADNRWPDDRSVPCYWPYHKPLFDVGVDGYWPDQGDGYDAPSRLNRTRMYWEGSQLWRPNERPLPCVATATPACSATPRSSGRAMCGRAGKRFALMSMSRSIRAYREFPTGAPTSAGLFRRPNTRANCTCAGSSSVPSAHRSALTAVTGTSACRGAGTAAMGGRKRPRRSIRIPKS